MLKLQMIAYLVFLIKLFIIFPTIKSNETQESSCTADDDKLKKLSSCIKLSNVRISDDNSYLLSTTKLHFPETHKEISFDNLYEALRHRILLTCYKQISLIKAAELYGLNVKFINPFKGEYQDLLSYASFKTIYPNFNENSNTKVIIGTDDNVDKYKNIDDDIVQFSVDTEKLEKLLNKIESSKEKIVYEEEIASFVDFITIAEQKLNSKHISRSNYKENDSKNSNKNNNSEDNDYLDDMEYSNLNLNIFGVDLMSPQVTNTVGAFLLLLVIYGIYLSYTIVVKKPEEKKKKKKDKKN